MRQRVTEPGQPGQTPKKKREAGLRTSRKPEARPLTLPRMALVARSLAHALQSRSCTVYGTCYSTPCRALVVQHGFGEGDRRCPPLTEALRFSCCALDRLVSAATMGRAWRFLLGTTALLLALCVLTPGKTFRVRQHRQCPLGVLKGFCF